MACERSGRSEFGWEPKNWSERVLPVPEALTEWFRLKHLPRLTWAEPDDFLLQHLVDVPGAPVVRRWSHQFYKHLRKVFDRAGIDPSLKLTHLIRASYVTDLLQHASVETVRQIVGHSAAITTIGYASALEEHKRDAIRKAFG
jgi:site-specific recombinase XerD